MIPKSAWPDESQLELQVSPSYTYKLDLNSKRIVGMVDGLDAVTQMIYKVLYTERYAWLIYDWDYGIELEQYLGEDPAFVIADIELSIREVLMVDDRILSVQDFKLDQVKIDALYVEFFGSTTEGETFFRLEVPA